MSVTFKTFLDTRRNGKSVKYPVKLRVTYKRSPKEFETIHALTEEDYNKLTAPRISKDLVKVRDDLNEIKKMMLNVAKKVNPFDFWVFNRDYIAGNPLFVQKKLKMPEKKEEDAAAKFDFSPYYKRFPFLKEKDESEYGTIQNVYYAVIKNLIMENRLGTALAYQTSYRTLAKYGGKNLRFADITVSWLRAFENYRVKRGKSRAGVGITLRGLRFMFNEAAHLGIISKEFCYPFGRRKYLVPTAANRKKSLTAEQIADIYYDTPSCESEKKAKAFWFFLYFGNGMNAKDMIHLRYQDIDGEYLTFYRKKTDMTARNSHRPVTVYLNEDMLTTIDLYGNKDKSPNNYIFPFINHDMDEMEIYILQHQV